MLTSFTIPFVSAIVLAIKSATLVRATFRTVVAAVFRVAVVAFTVRLTAVPAAVPLFTAVTIAAFAFLVAVVRGILRIPIPVVLPPVFAFPFPVLAVPFVTAISHAFPFPVSVCHDLSPFPRSSITLLHFYGPTGIARHARRRRSVLFARNQRKRDCAERED
jgi:hypothetical protein